MEVAIRPFRPDNWDGVFRLDRACFEPPYRLEYPRLRALIEDPGITVMVIEARDGDETAIVGSLMAKHEVAAGRLVLIGIMVDPGFRLAGLGRRLAGWAERIARARSLGELLAPLEAENEAGAAFLAALGFTREPGVLPFFDDPAGGNVWRRRLQTPAPAWAATTGDQPSSDGDGAQPGPAPSAPAVPPPASQESAGHAASPPRESETQAALSAAPDMSRPAAAPDGMDAPAPGPTSAGPKSRIRSRRGTAAEPAGPAERPRGAQKGVRHEANSSAGRKRRRT